MRPVKTTYEYEYEARLKDFMELFGIKLGENLKTFYIEGEMVKVVTTSTVEYS
jgi:hypothetical protein